MNLNRVTMIAFALRERFRRDEGASLIEYVLLVGLIALVCILAVTFLGEATSSQYSDVAGQLD